MNKEERFEIELNQEDVQNIINCYEKDIKLIKQLQQENKELKRNCNIGNENLSFYRNENKELHNKIEISIGILKTWKDFCEVKRKYCVGKDKEHWNYCIEKLEVLEEVLKGSDVDE